MLLCSVVLLLQGEVQALFLRHEGYLGAIGAFLKGAEEDSKEKLTDIFYRNHRLYLNEQFYLCLL